MRGVTSPSSGSNCAHSSERARWRASPAPASRGQEEVVVEVRVLSWPSSSRPPFASFSCPGLKVEGGLGGGSSTGQAWCRGEPVVLGPSEYLTESSLLNLCTSSCLLLASFGVEQLVLFCL